MFIKAKSKRINKHMLDKSQIRLEIINFFTTYCNNKLNKNAYNINFYKKRNKEYIYHWLLSYFNGTPLEHCSLAQKYYHIFWNHTDVPSTAFCNFQVGYRKGKRTFTSKSTSWLKYFLNNYKAEGVIETSHMQLTEAKEILQSYLKTASYKKLSENKELLNFILKEQKNIKADNYTKLCLFLTDNVYCICGCLKKVKKPTQITQTCGNAQCLVNIAVNNGKARDISYLQTDATKQKRVKSRSWYKPSKETIEKIIESNKKTWTPEKKLRHVQQNKENGVYKKISNTIKEKILAGEYTPKTQNRLTHKRLYSEKTGIKTYRSNWEVLFHEANPHLLYETLRVPYKFNGYTKVYIVDFWDPHNRVAIEVKPFSMTETSQNKAKTKALCLWCKNNNASYKIVTEKEFLFYE